MPEEKFCPACGHPIECDCTGVRPNPPPSSTDRALEEMILSLLARRTAGATICPSEAARQQFPEGWRDHMEDTRRAARRLVDAGKLEILQGGHVVDPSTARGAIRLRLRRA